MTISYSLVETITGTHIGKVMIHMAAEVSSQTKDSISQQAHVPCRVQAQFSCREDRCYIITGGLGG